MRQRKWGNYKTWIKEKQVVNWYQQAGYILMDYSVGINKPFLVCISYSVCRKSVPTVSWSGGRLSCCLYEQLPVKQLLLLAWSKGLCAQFKNPLAIFSSKENGAFVKTEPVMPRSFIQSHVFISMSISMQQKDPL